MPELYTPGSWEEFNKKKSEDARSGIMGQKALIPRLFKYLIDKGVSVKDAMIAVEEIAGPEAGEPIPGADPLADNVAAATANLYNALPWATQGGQQPSPMPPQVMTPTPPPPIQTMTPTPPPPAQTPTPVPQMAAPAPPQILPGNQADLRLSPLEKLARYLIGDPKPGIDRTQYATGEHIPGVDPVGDMIGAKMRNYANEMNGIEMVTPQPQWVDDTLGRVNSPPEQTIREAAGMPPAQAAPAVAPISVDKIEPNNYDQYVPDVVVAPPTVEDQLSGFLEGIDDNTLARIRAQAAMKGKAGSLSGRGGTIEEEVKRAVERAAGGRAQLHGGFSDSGPADPIVDQRVKDLQQFADEQGYRDATFMIENAQRRGRRPPTEAAAELRLAADSKAAQRRAASVDKLFESGVGPSGKISPEKAASIERLTGEKVPKYLVGMGKDDLSYQINAQAARLQAIQADLLAAAETDLSPNTTASLSKQNQRIAKALATAQTKAQKSGADYQSIYEEMISEITQAYNEFNMIVPKSGAPAPAGGSPAGSPTVIDGKVVRR